ncbi:MAG: helix-hairpin-helix domain-containing protein [Caldilineaceae bacterium]
MTGLGIRFVGEVVAQTLTEHFHSMEQLMGASAEELSEVEGIGPKIAESVVDFLRSSPTTTWCASSPTPACASPRTRPRRQRMRTRHSPLTA